MAEELLQGISVPITFDVDYTGIANAQQKLQDVHHEIDSMPNLNALTQRAIDAARYLGDTALKRYGDSYDMQFSDDADRARYIQRTNHVAKDFQASSQLLQADQGAFSLKAQHDIVSSLGKHIQTAFDQVIPNLGNIIRQRLDPDSSMSAQLPSRDIKTIQQFLYRDQEVQKALAPVHHAAGKSGLDERTAQQLIGVITARVQPSYTLDDYSKKRYGKSVSQETPDFTPQIAQLIPKSFLSSFEKKGYVHRPVDETHADEVLSSTGMKTLRKQLATNSDVVNAALSSGIAMRDERGTLQLLQNISRAQHESFREQLYKTFETRATGKGGPNGEDIYGLSSGVQRQRLGNGNTHALLTSMRTLEALDDQAAWTRERNPSPNLYRWAEEAPRHVKQYQTMRYAPFNPRVNPEMVTTDESQMTHLVGLDRRRANSDISDAFITLSMQGYDENNAQHQKMLDRLLIDGFNNGRQQYHVMAAHRSTEEGTVLRALSQSAYQQAIENVRPYVDQLRSLGMNISASDVFDLFQTDFSSLTDYRKNQDAKNKVYTSSYDTGVDLRKRKIAVIDTSYIGPDGKKIDLEDGAGWASGDVLPSSIQARGALGVKGSLISLTQQGTSLRDYYISTGMAQKKDQYGNDTEDYHVWRKGVNGDMTDIIDADMVLSASMVKNKSIFRKSDGSAMNSDEISRAMNIMFQMSPLRAITDYDTERKDSDRIGGQAMAFMQVPKEIAQMQIRGLGQRMRELSTPEGLKKYVFSDVENDALSAAIDRDPSLLTSSAAQKRINAYYASLARDMASGALIDFGQDPESRIRNARLVTNPANSFYQENGIPADVMEKALAAFRRDKSIQELYGASGEKKYREMTDEEIRKEISDTLTLQSGNAVDFANAKTRQLGIIRSPTGFGNYVSAVNRAQEMRVINEAIGAVLRESPGDIYVGQKDMNTLQGSDKDGDQAKVVTGRYMEMVRQSQEGYRQAIENAEKYGLITHVEAHELGTGEKINGDKMTMEERATRFRGFIEALNKEPMHMGVADSMQRAAALTGLFNPENGESVAASLRGAEYYDLFSTFAKKPTDAQLSRGDWSKRNAVGKEYGKFLKGLPRVFQTENVDDSDIFIDKETGEKINMRAFKEMGLSRINAHSMMNPSELMARELQGQMFAFGSGDVWTNGILRRAMDYYHDAYSGNTDKMRQGAAQRKANKAMDQILLAESMGRFFGTDEETTALRSLYDQSILELDREFDELQATGKLDPQGPKTKRKWKEKEIRDRGLLRISNYLDKFGATESRAREVLGDEKVTTEAMAQGDLGFIPVLREEWDRIQSQKQTPIQIATEQQAQRPKQRKEIFRSKQKLQNIIDSSKQHSGEQTHRPIRKPWVSMNEEERSSVLIDEMLPEASDAQPWINGFGPDGSLDVRREKKKPRGTMRNRLYNHTQPQTDATRDQTISSTQDAVQQRQALQNDAAVIGELLSQGSEWSKAMRAPMYKGKEQTYSENYIGKQSGMFRAFMNATDNYLDENNPLTHNQETGELTGFGTALQEKRKEMTRSFLDGTAAFIEQRSDSIAEKLRKDMSQAPDLDKAFESSQEYQKLGDEYKTLGKQFLETRRLAKGISEDTPLSAVEAGLTDDERKQYDKITSRSSKIQELSQRNQQRVYDQYVKGFQRETRGIDDLVASQQRQIFGEQLQRQNRASIMNSDITGFMNEQARRMLDRRSIQDQLDEKRTQLEGYEIEKKAIASDETLTEDQKVAKTKFADAAIEQTKAQVQGLTEALANAEARFQAFSGAEGFERLGESISGAREKLRQLSQGVQSDSALQKIMSVQDTIDSAKAANTRMRDQSGFYKDGKWDTSTVESKAARDAYMANLNSIRGMEGDRAQNYAAIHAQVQREHDVFMRSYGIRRTGAEDQLAQWYEDQEWRGSQREQHLKESIKETKRQIEKPKGETREERRQNREEAQKHLTALESQLEAVRGRSDSLAAGKDEDLARESTYQQERHENALALKEAQRGVQQRQFDQRMRQMTSGRFTQRTMLGRELEYIRSTREGAISRNEILAAQRSSKETEIKNLQARLSTAQESEKPQLQRDLEQAQSDLKTMNQEFAQNQQIIGQYPASLDGLSAAFNATASVGLSFATRLATQVFRKALQEAKNFVKQFDSQMTQIQMVTLKTDGEISTLGDFFIQKAIDMKTSVQDVTTAATALYRQGLNDQQVDERMGDILKFTKVGNVKAEDATKLATVAVNGGMVGSSMEAFNAVAAISDNAATDAAAITKGLQKSMYAAKSVGVSFNELVSMLAVITSKTQLSGQVAGTTMATVFSRLSRMRENQVVYDENGNATSASDVAVALHHAGVELYEGGEMRNAYQVLADLGKVWEGLGDTQKSSISYLLGAGRQASNLQALMEGFAEVDENGRSLVETYRELADASSGIVDEKYTAYAESVAAALTNVKNSFDAVIASISGSWFTDAANGFAQFLQALSGFTGIADGAVGKLTALAAVGAVIGTMLKTIIIPLIGPLLPVIGAIGAGVGIAAGIGAAVNHYNARKAYTSQDAVTERGYAAADRRAERMNNSYQNAQRIVDNWQQNGAISQEDRESLQVSLRALQEMGVLVLGANVSIQDLATDASAAATALSQVKTAVDEQNTKRSTKNAAKALAGIGEDLYFDAIQQYDGVVGYTEEQAKKLFLGSNRLSSENNYMPLLDDSPETLGTIALVKALYDTEGDLFGAGEEYVTKGKRDYAFFGGGYSDLWVKETKPLDEMTDEELLYALRHDQKLRDKLINVAQSEEFGEHYSQLKVRTPEQAVVDKLVEGFSGVEIKYGDQQGVATSDQLQAIFSAYVKTLTNEYGPITGENADFIKQKAFEAFTTDGVLDFDKFQAVVDGLGNIGIEITLTMPTGKSTTQTLNPLQQLAATFGASLDDMYRGKIKPSQYASMESSLSAKRLAYENRYGGGPGSALRLMMQDNSETFKSLFATKDADLLQIFEGAYKDGYWNWEAVTPQMLDEFERYLISKNTRMSGLGATQTAVSVRDDNAQSLDKLFSGTSASDLAGGDYQNSELIANLRKVGLSDETIQGLAGYKGTAAEKYIRAMNSAYGTGLDVSAFLSPADMRAVEDWALDEIVAGNQIPSEIMSMMSKKVSNSDWSAITGTGYTPEQRSEAIRHYKETRTGATEPVSKQTQMTNQLRAIEYLKNGGDREALKNQDFGADALQSSAIVDLMNKLSQGTAVTDQMYYEYTKQIQAAYYGLNTSDVYSTDEMQYGINEFIAAFSDGTQALDQWASKHTEEYVKMIQQAVGITGYEQEYADFEKRNAKAIQIANSRIQGRHRLSSDQMTSATRELDFVNEFFNRASTFGADKLAAWYDNGLTDDQRAILENDSRTSAFIKSDAFAALLGVDNGISREQALSQISDYRYGITAPVSSSQLADKATELTASFANVTADNLESVFAAYYQSITTMQQESPQMAQQFEQRYGTLIQDYKNALKGGNESEIKKAEQALKNAIAEDKNADKDWYPEYKKYIDGLSSLSEATRLETMFSMDDRLRELQNARYYADQLISGQYVTPEGYQAIAARYNLSEQTVRMLGRTEEGRARLKEYTGKSDQNSGQGMAESLLSGMSLANMDTMTFTSSEEFAAQIEQELGNAGKDFAQRVLDFGITIVNGVLGINISGIKTETQNLGELIADQLRSWQKDTYSGPKLLSMIEQNNSYNAFETALDALENEDKDNLLAYISGNKELGALMADWKEGTVTGDLIAQAMRSTIYGTSRTASDYKSILARFGNGTATTVDAGNSTDIQGQLLDAANDYKAGTIDIQKYLDVLALRSLSGGEELWSKLLNGQTITPEDYNKVIRAYQAMEESERYGNEDFYETFQSRIETARSGNIEQRESLSSDILSEIVNAQEAGYYIGQLKEGKTIGADAWSIVTSALGRDYTQDRYGVDFDATKMESRLTEMQSRYTAGMTTLILELLKDATGMEQDALLELFNGKTVEQAFSSPDLTIKNSAMVPYLKDLMGITGFSVSEGVAGINLGAKHRGRSVMDMISTDLQAHKQASNRTNWDTVFRLIEEGKAADEIIGDDLKDWASGNIERESVIKEATKPSGLMTKEKLHAYGNLESSGAQAGYDYYTTMFGSTAQDITTTLQSVSALDDSDPIKEMYLNWLTNLGDNGNALAQAIRHGETLSSDQNGVLTGTLGESLKLLMGDLSDMQMREELLNNPMLQDYLDIVGGMRSSYAPARGKALSTAMTKRNQLSQAQYYMGEIDNGQILSQSGYEAVAAVTGFTADEVERLSKSQTGKTILKNSLQDANRTIGNALALTVENSSDEAGKVISELKASGGTFNTESVASALATAGVDSAIIDYVRQIGYTIANGIAGADIPADSLTPTLNESIKTGVDQWRRSNDMVQAGKLLEIFSDPYKYAQEHGVDVSTNVASAMSTADFAAIFASIQDADLNSWLTSNQEAIGYSAALMNPNSPNAINYEDYTQWLRYAQLGYTGPEAYDVMQRNLFGGQLLSYSGTSDYYTGMATNLMEMYSKNVANPDMFTTGLFAQLGGVPNGGADVISLLQSSLTGGADAEQIGQALQLVALSIHDMEIDKLYLASEYMKSCTENAKAMAKGGQEAFYAMKNLESTVDTFEQAKGVLGKLKAGKTLDPKEITALAKQSKLEQYDEANIKRIMKKGSKSSEYARMVADLSDDFDFQERQIREDIGSQATEALQRALSSGIDVGQQEILVGGMVNVAAGEMDIAGLDEMLQSLGIADDIRAGLLAQAQMLQDQGIKWHVEGSVDKNGSGKVEVVVDEVPDKTLTKGGGGGGGGGGKSDTGKSATDIFLERVKQSKKLFDHRQNMINYEETKYENRGELTNLNNALMQDNELKRGYMPSLQKMITRTKKQMKGVTKYSDDWYKLRDTLFELEEEYKKLNNEIEENEKKIKENTKAILDANVAVQESIRDEINARIQLERDMLDGKVSMEDTILQAIQSRYQKEWDLVKQDVDKKKQALEEEKALIDERLQKRKEAADEAKKYEELAELKSQYANISMDSTRTKDAAQLREKIMQLEEEIGWDIAEKQAESEKQSIQDRLDALDNYVQYGDDQLEKLLSDANNFAGEVTNVIGMEYDELLAWLQASDESYLLSLEDKQKQIVNSWRDTWEQMTNYVDNHEDEIAYIMSSKDNFINYMKQSQEFQNALSDEKRASLLYEYEELWDTMYNANLDTTTGENLLHLLKSEGTYWAQYVYEMIQKNSGSNNSNGSGNGNGNGKSAGTGDATPKTYSNASDSGGPDKPNVRMTYGSGGLSTKAGPAWLDGTFQKPERVLDAEDTALFEELVKTLHSLDDMGLSGMLNDMFDWSGMAHVNASLTNVSTSSLENNITTIGDVYVTLNEAKLQEDADYYEVAMRVGEVFTKELSKQGIRTAFSF